MAHSHIHTLYTLQDSHTHDSGHCFLTERHVTLLHSEWTLHTDTLVYTHTLTQSLTHSPATGTVLYSQYTHHTHALRNHTYTY